MPVPPFLQKTYEIISETANDEICGWGKENDSIFIKNVRLLGDLTFLYHWRNWLVICTAYISLLIDWRVCQSNPTEILQALQLCIVHQAATQGKSWALLMIRSMEIFWSSIKKSPLAWSHFSLLFFFGQYDFHKTVHNPRHGEFKHQYFLKG